MDASAYETRRWTWDEVLRLVEIGVIRPEDPVEYIDGRLIEVAPQGPAHIRGIVRLNKLVTFSYGPDWQVQCQGPVDCTDADKPEPDIAVIPQALWSRATDRLSRADETVLLIEVAVTSQRYDRAKAAVYANAGAPEYWVLDVPAERLIVSTEPVPGEARYQRCETFEATQSITFPGIDQTVGVAELLR